MSNQAPRKYRCPNCGQRSGVRVMYGYPAPEAVAAEKAKTLVLGGCMMTEHDPERGCTECGHRWFIKRRKPDGLSRATAPDYFCITLSGYPFIADRIEWKDGHLYSGKWSDLSCLPKITEIRWNQFWMNLYAQGIDLWRWSGYYPNLYGVCDGEQWQISLEQAGFKRTLGGNNNYPTEYLVLRSELYRLTRNEAFKS